MKKLSLCLFVVAMSFVGCENKPVTKPAPVMPMPGPMAGHAAAHAGAAAHSADAAPAEKKDGETITDPAAAPAEKKEGEATADPAAAPAEKKEGEAAAPAEGEKKE